MTLNLLKGHYFFTPKTKFIPQQIIVVQKRGTALGSAFGGGGEFYLARRGLEKKLFFVTIFLGILFIALALLGLIL